MGLGEEERARGPKNRKAKRQQRTGFLLPGPQRFPPLRLERTLIRWACQQKTRTPKNRKSGYAAGSFDTTRPQEEKPPNGTT
jgi:hypothetical protein